MVRSSARLRNGYASALAVHVFAITDGDNENGPRPVLNVADEPVIADPVLPESLERSGIALTQGRAGRYPSVIACR